MRRDLGVVAGILLPQPGGGSATVRFDRGWMVVNDGGGDRGELSFGYQTPEGDAAVVTRQPGTGGGFAVTISGRTRPARRHRASRPWWMRSGSGIPAPVKW